MFPAVSVVLVARSGGVRLPRTLAALAEQGATGAVVVVLQRADDEVRSLVAGAAPSHVVELAEDVPFGRAVAAGVAALPEPPDGALLWLLTEDSAPEPGALAALAGALEVAPSVGIAGPKLVEWDRADRLVSFGRTVTRYGRAVELVEPGLDQGQEDERSDVLAVAPAGLLVRRSVWDRLGGFDPALPDADDGLDLGVRAHLAGHRVAVVPEARVAFAADGVADPPADGGARVRRRTERRRRRAELHRRLADAPAWAVPLHWLSLLPLAIARAVLRLVGKRPASIPGELAAAVQVLVGLPAVARSRAGIRRVRTERWSALAPLRLNPAEVARRRQAAQELRRERARGRRHELRFLATGGGWVLLVSAVVSAVLFWRLLGLTGVSGDGLLPLSDSLGELWRNAGYGWRDLSVGFLAPADPFSGILAVFGTIAFWSPSAGVAIAWLLAVPAAAMGAWMLAARLSERAAVRAVAATVWGLAPMFLTALADGRPGAMLAHVLLPWLGFAALAAARGWAAAGAAALLLAATVAAAPSLAPLLALAWLVALVRAGRGVWRVLWMPVPALVLGGPVLAAAFGAGVPLGAFADPGLPAPGEAVSVWQLAAGFPGGGWGGWVDVFAASPFDAVDPRWLAIVLLAPLAVLAFGSLAAWPPFDALAALAFAGGGFATAVAASRISVASIGADAVGLWTGAGLSAGLLGLLVAAVCGLRALPRLRGTVAVLLAATGVVVSLPLTVGLATGGAEIRPAAERRLPAFVTAEAEHDPEVATLRLTPQADGGLRAVLEHGAGASLDDQSTLWYTGARDAATAERVESLERAAGNLASRSGFDTETAIEQFGIRYVLLSEGDATTDAAAATRDRAVLALDSDPDVVVVGDTAFGRLWRLVGAEPHEPGAAPLEGPGTTGALLTALQLVVLGITVLLAIPVGAPEQARAPRPRRGVRRRRGAAPDGAGPDGSAGPGGASADEPTDASAEPGEDAGPGAASADEPTDASAGPEDDAGPGGALETEAGERRG